MLPGSSCKSSPSILHVVALLWFAVLILPYLLGWRTSQKAVPHLVWAYRRPKTLARDETWDERSKLDRECRSGVVVLELEPSKISLAVRPCIISWGDLCWSVIKPPSESGKIWQELKSKSVLAFALESQIVISNFGLRTNLCQFENTVLSHHYLVHPFHSLLARLGMSSCKYGDFSYLFSSTFTIQALLWHSVSSHVTRPH